MSKELRTPVLVRQDLNAVDDVACVDIETREDLTAARIYDMVNDDRYVD